MAHSTRYRAVSNRTTSYSNNWIDRFTPVPYLLINFIVCGVLVVLKAKEWRSSSATARYVIANRATVAIIIQLLSHILGYLQVRALLSITKASFTLSMSNLKSFSLRSAQFMHALVTPRMVWSLSWLQTIVLFLILLTSFAPAAVWSGALTPVVARNTLTQRVGIPTFDTHNQSALWSGNLNIGLDSGGSWGAWLNDKGFFSFDPTKFRNAIVQPASDAPSQQKANFRQLKLDKTGYLYKGRSYGAGSGAGLTDTEFDSNQPQWYSYSELGLYSDFQCTRNSSSRFRLDNLKSGQDGYNVYLLTGTLQDGSPFTPLDGMTPMIFTYAAHDAFAWGVSYDKNRKRTILTMAKDDNDSDDAWDFRPIHNVQCSWQLRCMDFAVLVNSSDATITVTPKQEDKECPEFGGAVMEKTAYWLSNFPMTDTSYGASLLGQSLRLNVQTLQDLQDSKELEDATIMQGVQDAVNAMVDNILIHLASTRYVSQAAEPAQTIDADCVFTAVVIGDWTYLTMTLAINGVILFIYIIELIRTRAWLDICSFDLLDLGHIIIGTGKGTTNECRRQYASMVVDKPQYQQTHVQIQYDENGTGSWSLVLADPRVSDPDQCRQYSLHTVRSQGSAVDRRTSRERLVSVMAK